VGRVEEVSKPYKGEAGVKGIVFVKVKEVSGTEVQYYEKYVKIIIINASET